MYCSKCGKPNADGARFCENCGNNLAAGAQPPAENNGFFQTAGDLGGAPATESTPVTPVNETSSEYIPPVDNASSEYIPPADNTYYGDYSAPVKQNNKKKLIAIAACAVAAILVIVLIISNLGGGYKTPIKNMVSGINKGDMDTFLKAFPKPVIEAIKDDADNYDEMKDGFEELMDSFEDQYGNDFKVSYEITDEDECSDSDLEDYEDLLKARYEFLEEEFDFDLDKPEVTAGYELEVEMTTEGEEDDDTEEVTFYVYKVDGKWTLNIGDMMF